MRHYLEMRCKRCNTVMVYVQRRGTSQGMWLCPVCASARRVRLSLPDEEEQAPVGPKDSDGSFSSA
jgi:hypothetical protein